MHRHAGGLVDGDQLLVLQQNGEFARRRRALVHGALGHAHRRHAHHVAGLHAGVGAGAALVQAHLAAADDAVDVRLGHALEVAQQEVVQPLAGAVGVHQQPNHLGFARGRRRGGMGTYNAIHWQPAVSG
jgi:hypothetical protein